MRILITHDVFDIVNRIKNIDKDYFIMYNLRNKKFEVHNYKNINTTYSLTIPYNTLDINTLYYVQKTHISNIDNVLDEIEKSNNNLINTAKNNLQDLVDYRSKDIYKYAFNTTKDFRADSAYKNKWF